MSNDFEILQPSAIHKVWGGTRLAKIKGIELGPMQEPLGETWEISIHKDGPSFTSDQTPLSKIITPEQMPYLVKYIDTSDNLSVQVHPGDDFAKKHENSKGKTECWIILDAKEGEGIYLGFRDGVTKEQFEQGLKNNEDMSKFLQFYPVKTGDFFYIPAGNIHAIGKDVLLAEVQQNSGITYRVWDWNRVDESGNGRELHIDKALQVIDFSKEFNNPSNFKVTQNVLSKKHFKLIEHAEFKVESYYKENEEVDFLKTFDRAISILCLEGEMTLNSSSSSLDLNSFQAALVQNQDCKKIKLQSSTKAKFLIIS